MSGGFPSADVELFPTAKGNFHAEITQVGMNGLWMHRIHISLPEINTVAIKPGRRSIGFVTECSSSSLLDCGLEVRPGDVVINRSDVVHQRSDAASAIWGNTLPAVKREWKSVDRLTSGAFVAMWRDRVETLYARYPAPTLRMRDA
jgi:hypothetical protein